MELDKEIQQQVDRDELIFQKKYMSRQFNIKDIPMGTCCKCGYVQKKPAEEGIWICGLTDRWACYNCKYGYIKDKDGNVIGFGEGIPSRPFACEWCTYEDPQFFQGLTYRCPRCETFGIGQATIRKELKF